MGSRLAEAIKETCVKPEVEKKKASVVARIMETYPNRKAKIQYTNHKSGGIINVDNVQVGIESRGVMGTTVSKGDLVVVAFMGDYGNLPVITRLLDPEYDTTTKTMAKHDRKGAFLPDSLCMR